MTTLKLDEVTHDFIVAGGAFQDVSGEQEIRQNVAIRLLLFMGENPWDTELGMPYHDEILKKGIPPERLEFLFRDAIEGTVGVVAIVEGPTFPFNDATRTLSIEFRAQTDVGLLDFSLNLDN